MDYVFVTIKECLDSGMSIEFNKEIYLKRNKNYLPTGNFKEIKNQKVIINLDNQYLKKSIKECFLKFPVIKIKNDKQ